MISAHSGAHSFDAAHMNMTHYVGFFSFGRKTSWRSVHWANDMLPELDTNTDRLTGNVFTSEHENITVCGSIYAKLSSDVFFALMWFI
jgi:hypothetical protein